MGVRAELAEALEPHLDEVNVQIVTTMDDLSEPDPDSAGVAQIIRRKVAPGTRLGEFDMEFDLWIVAPYVEPDAVEDHLDDLVDAVVEALQNIPWLTWDDAVREMHPSNFHAYRFTLKTKANSSS